jgi:hypothetical protein
MKDAQHEQPPPGYEAAAEEEQEEEARVFEPEAQQGPLNQ